MPAHNINESIEGLKIKGYSRDPIRSQSMKRISGKRYLILKAEFNVSAEIDKILQKGTNYIDVNALKEKGDRLSCDTAMITTLAKKQTPKSVKISQKLKSNVTATHSSNEWCFGCHTNIKVITPRQEIINAIEKRNRSIESNN